MTLIEKYNGYDIECSSTPDATLFFIVKEGEWDYEQVPFLSLQEARDFIDMTQSQRLYWISRRFTIIGQAIRGGAQGYPAIYHEAFGRPLNPPT